MDDTQNVKFARWMNINGPSVSLGGGPGGQFKPTMGYYVGPIKGGLNSPSHGIESWCHMDHGLFPTPCF